VDYSVFAPVKPAVRPFPSTKLLALASKNRTKENRPKWFQTVPPGFFNIEWNRRGSSMPSKELFIKSPQMPSMSRNCAVTLKIILKRSFGV
jgi:hypothetical protein